MLPSTSISRFSIVGSIHCTSSTIASTRPNFVEIHELRRQQRHQPVADLLRRGVRQPVIRRVDLQQVADQRQMLIDVEAARLQPLSRLGELVRDALFAHQTERSRELLGDRKQRGVLVQGRALIAQHGGLGADAIPGRLHEARFADAGVAGQQDDLSLEVGRPPPPAEQQLDLLAAADQRRRRVVAQCREAVERRAGPLDLQDFQRNRPVRAACACRGSCSGTSGRQGAPSAATRPGCWARPPPEAGRRHWGSRRKCRRRWSWCRNRSRRGRSPHRRAPPDARRPVSGCATLFRSVRGRRPRPVRRRPRGWSASRSRPSCRRRGTARHARPAAAPSPTRLCGNDR